MKLAKARREIARLKIELADHSHRLTQYREAWPSLAADRNRLLAEQREERLTGVRTRRADLARVANLHPMVQRRATSRRGAERNYCETCNDLWPCRTITVLGRLNDDLDALWRELRSS